VLGAARRNGAERTHQRTCLSAPRPAGRRHAGVSPIARSRGRRLHLAGPAVSLGAVLLALFAGICVGDLELATEWYSRLFGNEPSFFPNDAEAVWELAEHRSIYIKAQPESAGHSIVTIFVDDLDQRVAGIAKRGILPSMQETYDNGVRKTVYCDRDGNEIGFGGASNAT
jgi:hypothetical protein